MDVYPTGQCPDHTVIAVRGDIDLATADELLASLRGFLGPTGSGIGLDLSQVTFLDCAGLRPLMAVEELALREGVSVCLAAVSPAVTRLLGLIGLAAGSSYLAAPATPTPVSNCVSAYPGFTGIRGVRPAAARQCRFQSRPPDSTRFGS
jgi:anti-anti-sigma factor